ncbi:MAG: hypothetical protein KJ709_02715 [Nanoarchaeota archaeon]|nr:hypothetical protein [Nanoarchaeota archaeon]
MSYIKNSKWIEYYPVDKRYITAFCGSPDCGKERKHKLFILRAMLKIGPFRLFPMFRGVEAYCTECNWDLFIDKESKSAILSRYGKKFMPNMRHYREFYIFDPKSFKKRLIIQYLLSFPVGGLLTLLLILIVMRFTLFFFQPTFDIPQEVFLITFIILMIYQTILYAYQYVAASHIRGPVS